MTTTLPTVMTAAGLQPTPPAALLAQLLAAVTATNPGFTANLPGSLVEDISSTDVAAIALCDAAKVELVNSLTPFGANAFLVTQLGQLYGIELGKASNTSVSVVVSGPPGFVIAKGFTVSDGTYQYVLQNGGIIGADHTSPPLYAVAPQPGTWPVPSGTVQTIITSVPSTIVLTVNNPLAGTPSAGAQNESSYRAQVLQAGLAASQGMSTMLKALLGKVAGVQQRLVSVIQVPNNGGWEIIVGGGDPYQVAFAIYMALFDISTLVGSVLQVTAITNANPGVVTIDLNHGYETGQVVEINGVVGMAGINGVPLTATVVDAKRFSIGINTTGSGSYVSGGIVTPNFRNVAPSISDYPDTYVVPFVNPPQQEVAITVTWNTTATNFVSEAAISQLGTPPLVDYVNGIAGGQPMNLFELQTTFQVAVSSVLPPQLLTRMLFGVSIDGVGVSPESGTGIIAGDPESYFLTSATLITIQQG